MNNNSILRVAPGPDGVSIWSSEIFGTGDALRVREFLLRAFSVSEVRRVELQRGKSYGRIQYAAVNSPGPIWKKLSAALKAPAVSLTTEIQSRLDVEAVYLDGPRRAPVHVSRIGNSLSTWRVRYQSEDRLLLWHPALRNRRDVVFRLEEELAAIFGVRDFSASALTAGVDIRFDKDRVTADRLARELEKAWPRLLDGLDSPPSRTRLFTAVGLLGLSFTGQYVVPALRPAALAGVALYSAPNVFNAAKQLARGQVGLSALYTTGLGFALASGQPFSSSLFAVLMQFWPHLARRKLVRTQRRLFAPQRRRPGWARVAHATGIEVEVNASALRKGERVVVGRGEIVPVDGVVEEGTAAVLDGALFGSDHAKRKTRGDDVPAGAFVRDGRLTIRVERTGADTTASYVASLLPRGPIEGLPSALEAERIANRNAKPALALAALSLGVTRTPRIAQALIRPDYATGPRLSSQFTALHSLGRGLQRGVLFRNLAALERLSEVDAIVFDDTAGLDRRRSGEIAGTPVVAQLRAQYPRARIVYVSRSPRADVEALAGTLGIERFHPRASAAAKLDVIRGLGGKTLWIGDGSEPQAREQLAASTVSVSVAPLSRVRDDAADILLPHTGLDGLAELIELGRAHASRLEQDYRVIYAVNTLGAAGGLLARFGSLQSGLLSHLGNGLIYARHARDLDRLIAGVEAKHVALTQLARQ
jgi:cation transport ATPase